MRSAVPHVLFVHCVVHLYLLTHIQLSTNSAVAKTSAELNPQGFTLTARLAASTAKAVSLVLLAAGTDENQKGAGHYFGSAVGRKGNWWS